MIFFAYFAVFILQIIFAFQIALALGAPFGEYAMGGKYPGKFPLKIRIAAVIQALLLQFFSAILLIRSGILFKQYYEFSENAIWFVFAFSIIATILNSITPSKKERMIWAPVSAILMIFVLIVAIL